MLKQKLGEKEAKLFFEYIEEKVGEQVDHATTQLATKQDLMQAREDLLKEITNVKSELIKNVYTIGLIQFLAIVGSVIGVISFMLHK